MRLFRLDVKPLVYFSPIELNVNSQEPFPKIIETIEQAEKKIDIAMYAISSPEIVTAVLAAIKRGIKIRLIADEWMMSGGMRDILQQF